MMQPTIHNTLGLLYDALVLSSALFGVACLQGWFYFRRYRLRDSWKMQSLVVAILVCEVCQMSFFAAATYDYTVSHQGDPTYLLQLVDNLIIQLFFSAFIALAVQQFYCHRILLLSKNWTIAVGVSLISWSAFITLIIYTVRALGYTLSAELALLQTMSTVTNSLAAATDVVISLVMIFILERSKTGFRRSADVINRLILFSFNTGLPTSACALAAVISINAAPSTYLYIFFFILMGRFYTNSILVILNSRDFIREGSQPGESYSLSVPRVGAASQRQNQDAIQIRIETTTQNYNPNDKDSTHEEEVQGKAAAV